METFFIFKQNINLSSCFLNIENNFNIKIKNNDFFIFNTTLPNQKKILFEFKDSVLKPREIFFNVHNDFDFCIQEFFNLKIKSDFINQKQEEIFDNNKFYASVRFKDKIILFFKEKMKKINDEYFRNLNLFLKLLKKNNIYSKKDFEKFLKERK